MEQTMDWSLLDEIEDDSPITEQSAQNVRDHAAEGCLICAIEEGGDEWDDE
jgi:hypothetical protein